MTVDYGDTKATFTAPSDWVPTTVNGHSNYWIRIGSGLTVPHPMWIWRLSAMHDYSAPTAGERGSTYAPLAYADGDTAGTGFKAYDALVPRVSSPSPKPNHDSTSARPTIGAALADAETGIDRTSARVSIDGGAAGTAAVDTSDRATYTPSSNLPRGVRTATITARDFAGNVASSSWAFDSVTFATTNAPNASVAARTVNTNPNPIGAPPTTVTFSNLTATLERQTYSLSSSDLWAGYGSLTRSATLSGMTVKFKNETGSESTVAIPTRTVTYTTRMGVLEPSTGALKLEHDPQTVQMPDVTVAIPLGYNTVGSTATFSGANKAADAPTIAEDPLPNPFAAGAYALDGGGIAGPPVLETHIVTSAGTTSTYTIGTSPRLSYPCDSSEPACQAIRVLGNAGGTLAGPHPSELDDRVPTCNSPCAHVTGGPVDASFSVAQPPSPLPSSSFSVWQRMHLLGTFPTGGSQPDRLLLWQHSVVSGDTCLSGLAVGNGSAALSYPMWKPKTTNPSEVYFSPTTNPTGGPQRLHLLVMNDTTGAVVLESVMNQVQPTAIGYTASMKANGLGWDNNWVQDPSSGPTTDAPRVITGSYFQGSGTGDFVSTASFTATYSPGASPNCPLG